MAENTQADVKKLSFERAMEELESIVKRLEDGKVPLEESVAIYERGEALKRRCEELLRQAEARVDKITTDANGQVTGTCSDPGRPEYRTTRAAPGMIGRILRSPPTERLNRRSIW
jgi:exodeoxyribonuclease VII small subunit